MLDVSGRNLAYDNAWEVLGSNIDGYPEHLLGPDNLDIYVTSGLFSSAEIDFVFFPIDTTHMHWKKDFSWTK